MTNNGDDVMRMTKREQFQQYVSYDPMTGALVWRADRPPTEKECARTYKAWVAKCGGKQAGTLHKNQYNTYLTVSIGNVRYLAHRVVAALLYGEIPDGMVVDHIDGDGLNNSAANIRIVDPETNNRNMKRQARTRYEVPGIRKVERAGGYKWNARARVDLKEVSLGCFETREEAVAARLAFQKSDGRYTDRHGRAGQ